MLPNQPCPCDSLQTYQNCCQRWHVGALYLQAPDPLHLMRSRYSAYVLNDIAYLQATWHISTRPSEFEKSSLGLRWLGLQIKAYHAQSAQVHFVARYRFEGKGHRLEEISHFVKESGVWYYVDGTLLS